MLQGVCIVFLSWTITIVMSCDNTTQAPGHYNCMWESSTDPVFSGTPGAANTIATSYKYNCLASTNTIHNWRVWAVTLFGVTKQSWSKSKNRLWREFPAPWWDLNSIGGPWRSWDWAEGAGDQLPTCLISGQSPSQRQSQIQGTSWGQFIEDLMLIAQRRCNFHKLRLIVNTSLKDQLKSERGLRLVSSQGGWYAHCPAIAPPKLHIGSRAGSLLLHERSSIFDTWTHIALYCCTGRAFDPDKTGHREAIGQAFEGISYYPLTYFSVWLFDNFKILDIGTKENM